MKVALIFVGVIIEAAAYRKNVRSIGSETSHPKPMVFLLTIHEKFPLDVAMLLEDCDGIISQMVV